MKKSKILDSTLLHIYGQAFEHSEAYIVGTKNSLLHLKRAIEDAIESGNGTAELTAADGEGYSTNIICREDEWSDFWIKLSNPYYGEYSEDTRKDRIIPAEFWHNKNRDKP